jgi:hypothetical protein
LQNFFLVDDIHEHPVDLSTRSAYYVGLRTCGYPPAYLPTRFTDSRRYSRRKCVPTSDLSCEAGSARRCAQIYSTSGRGKGVPRRSYTHATRHRPEIDGEKEKKHAESRTTMPKTLLAARPVKSRSSIRRDAESNERARE